jgi:hypothetical protein
MSDSVVCTLLQVLEIPGFYVGPCKVLAALFDEDIPPNTDITEYGGVPTFQQEAERIHEESPHLAKWFRWLMRGELQLNGCPTDYAKMADEDTLASIADHSFEPNCDLVDKNWISPRTHATPTLILRSKGRMIPRSTRDRLSLLTYRYGPADLVKTQHGIVRGECPKTNAKES